MAATDEELQRYLRWLAQNEDGGLEALPAEPEQVGRLVPAAAAGDQRIEAASRAATKVVRGEPVLEEDERDALEAIIIPGQRPVVDIVDGSYVVPPEPYVHFGEDRIRSVIEAAIPSVGRIGLPDNPALPFGGTGFLVGDGLLMTNRHVAELFANGLGREALAFSTGQSADVDFLQERGRDGSARFQITKILMVHPYWDMALLAVTGLDDRQPLRLSIDEPEALGGRDVAVMGYPAFDPRNNVELQKEIFNSAFNVKRLQPGSLRERRKIRSFGHDVNAVTHDSSTLGGNSGSVVLDVSTGDVVALHFAGLYLDANFAVPSFDLAGDGRVVDSGVRFAGAVAPSPSASDSFWSAADPQGSEQAAGPSSSSAVAVTATATMSSDAMTWVVPLEITVRVGAAAPAAAAATPEIERAVEPVHDLNLATRTGYDEAFLGVDVALPALLDDTVVSKTDDGDHVLRYEHFSIVVHKGRRLALFSAVNIDASPNAKKPEPGRDYTRKGLTGLGENDREKWFTDPRIPAVHQLPDKFYDKDRQAFDKGHIVRREDPAWGATFADVQRGNGDTYYVTNCTPQVKGFNRRIWLDLENLVLNAAETERLCVFTGPVLADDDPEFHGVGDDGPIVVRIPQQYWKIAVARVDDHLESFGFHLEQDLSGVRLTESLGTEFAVPAEWQERMISLPSLEQLLGELRFPDDVRNADQFGQAHGEAVAAAAGIQRYPV